MGDRDAFDPPVSYVFADGNTTTCRILRSGRLSNVKEACFGGKRFPLCQNQRNPFGGTRAPLRYNVARADDRDPKTSASAARALSASVGLQPLLLARPTKFFFRPFKGYSRTGSTHIQLCLRWLSRTGWPWKRQSRQHFRK